MDIVIFIFAGLLLYFLFRILMRISKTFIGSSSIRKISMALLPALELVIWVAYVFRGLYMLFGGRVYYEFVVVLMASLVMAAIAWFLFRDYLSGVLLKAEKSLEPGRKLKTPYVEGRIKKLGSRVVEVINNEGALVRVPYSRLSSEIFVLPPTSEDKLPHYTTVTISKGQNPERIREAALEQLLAMPWVTEPGPEVNIRQSEEGETVLGITYFTHINSQAAIVEERLKSYLEKT